MKSQETKISNEKKNVVIIIQDIITLFQICQDIEYKLEMTVQHASFLSLIKKPLSHVNKKKEMSININEI